jgi:hypothetical protein
MSANPGLVAIGAPEPPPKELWTWALDDAAVLADRAVLFVFQGRSATGNQASSWVPGTKINGHDELQDFGKHIHLANSPEIRVLHRVAIWPEERPHEVCAALLRHELEHSRQYEMHGRIVRDLFWKALDMLRKHAAGVYGAGVLYQHIPMELDADAAASGFTRTVYGHAAVDVHEEGHWPLLARTAHTPDPYSIHSRMQQFVECDGPELASQFAAAIGAGADPKQFRRPSP